MPAYLSDTTERVTTESFYWANRVIAALADARFNETSAKIESYQEKIGSLGHKMLRETDKAAADLADEQIPALLARPTMLCAPISRSQRTSCSGRCSTSRAAR